MFEDKIQRKENLLYGWLAQNSMAAKIGPVRVTCGDADAARDLRVHFLKLVPSHDF